MFEKYQLFENYMKTCMSDSAHDTEHIYRVLNLCLELAKYENGVDFDILIISALLHDIGYFVEKKSHHKHSLELILKEKFEEFSDEEVLIIATGENKATALKHGIEGSISHVWTISALQMHPHGIILCDTAATKELSADTVSYFMDIEKNNF